MWTLLILSMAGFTAQLIGGTIGMAFGVTATTSLILLSYSPAAASSIVHLVEIGTSLFNGIFHSREKNVDWRVVLLVSIPGAIGAFVGALLLSRVNLNFSKPWTASLLLLLGVMIIWRFLDDSPNLRPRRPHGVWLSPLGLGAGFVDATAGGGWGIITTSSLMATKQIEPKRVVGTTSTARLLVAIAGSLGFLIGIGTEKIAWDAVGAMLLGGIIAAPIAAKLVTRVPRQALGLATGVVVIVLNARQLAVSFGASLELVLLVMGVSLVVTLAPIFWITTRRRKTASTGVAESRQTSEFDGA